MTEKSTPLSTQFVPPSQTTAAGLASPPPLLQSAPKSKVEAVEEEPYTIKCICGFSDDDGNTIYCETCDSWQHIECYYPNNIQEAYREDFAHSCVDCKFRPLDHQRAFEHQSLRKSNLSTTEVPDRSKKRPPSKSHKKKKPADVQVNGQTAHDPFAKGVPDNAGAQGHRKSKSLHRSSQSVSSKDPKRSPSFGQKPGNPHGHPPSPATTPPDNLPQELEVHNYSSGFHDLYKEENDFPIVQTNSFVSLVISNILSLWLRDHDKLKEETGCDYADVFQPLPPNTDSGKNAPVVEHKKEVLPDIGLPLHWQYLRAPNAVDKDVPLIELNGQIGIQKNYCEDPENRWSELSSPLPFVFFHPMLPIYIDTRKEGSQARYVRRSCQPNAILDTFLSGGSEYHFWLVSDRPITQDEEITIPWDFRLPKQARMLQLLGLGDDGARPQPEFDANDLESYHQTASWVHTVLSEYGGCACELGPECAFARFHRTYISRVHPKSLAKKKSRKTKTNGLSPTGVNPSNNSRAASEGHGEDGVENDSGSSRSKPPSRDMTPARQGSFDTLGVLTEMTDREKRKVQMAEDTFRRMEQQQPPRKKKRTSDGTNGSTSSKSKTPKLTQGTSTGTNGASERRYVDAGTSRRVSGSPAISPGAGDVRMRSVASSEEDAKVSRTVATGQTPQYRDCGVQTDPVEGEWFSPPPQTPKPRKRVISLSKRLLQNRYRYRADDHSCRRSIGSPSSVVSALIKMDLDSPTISPRSPILNHSSIKTTMTVSSTTEPAMADTPVSSASNAKESSDESETQTAVVVKAQSPEMRVQLPPVPTFESAESGNAPKASPAATTTPVIQSPTINISMASPFAPSAVNGIAAHPSPVKKKLSLSDYTKSRLNKAAATKPSTTPLKISVPALDDVKSPTTDVVMVDSNMEEKSPS
ncbi:uncharacterized protein B0I36DRAFT_362775 [Microdochium trichocladiopsis]|uniref:SET domain-containing protein n=1 Tax=Microdochium trichocladiopsis TaxID=1682393 RepID=A0A9P8Y779_9PEZI|nr:uncharacterized protein B0I36DRAFT_362775 [Microdochium trichocladiopsis]KAH7030998.1 hypothetical protein B0I36DRAFT_362775 [Microdochium trichocladiopsis]